MAVQGEFAADHKLFSKSFKLSFATSEVSNEWTQYYEEGGNVRVSKKFSLYIQVYKSIPANLMLTARQNKETCFHKYFLILPCSPAAQKHEMFLPCSRSNFASWK